jgi:hypothetical protein
VTLAEDYDELVLLMEGASLSGEFRAIEKWLGSNGWSKQSGSDRRPGYTSTWTRGFVKNPDAVAAVLRRVQKFKRAVKGQIDPPRPHLLTRVRVYNKDTRRMNTILRFEIGRPTEYSWGTLSLREPGIAPHRPKREVDPRQQRLSAKRS